MIQIKVSFTGFTEKDKIAAMENAVSDELRKHGLSHLRAKVRRSSGDNVDIIVEGGTENDIKRAEQVLGATSDVSFHPERIEADLKAITTPVLFSVPKIHNRKKPKS